MQYFFALSITQDIILRRDNERFLEETRVISRAFMTLDMKCVLETFYTVLILLYLLATYFKRKRVGSLEKDWAYINKIVSCVHIVISVHIFWPVLPSYDTSTAPHQCYSAVVQIPVMDLGGLS